MKNLITFTLLSVVTLPLYAQAPSQDKFRRAVERMQEIQNAGEQEQTLEGTIHQGADAIYSLPEIKKLNLITSEDVKRFWVQRTSANIPDKMSSGYYSAVQSQQYLVDSIRSGRLDFEAQDKADEVNIATLRANGFPEQANALSKVRLACVQARQAFVEKQQDVSHQNAMQDELRGIRSQLQQIQFNQK